MPLVLAASAPTSLTTHPGPAAHLAAPAHADSAAHLAASASAGAADNDWYRSITSFAQHTPWLQGAMAFYTVGGIGLLLLMALYAAWSARARADQAAMAAVLWLGLGTALSISCGLVLKQIFRESRPCQVIHVATVQACPGPADYSFPSDHSIFAFALAVGLWIVSRRLGVVAVVLAVVEGFSRVYLGQHYPHDVIAGASVSVVILLVGWTFARRPLNALVATLETTPLRPLLTSAPASTPADEPAAGNAQTTVGHDRG
jgi:membrane-associated phospholipid phosphatase